MSIDKNISHKGFSLIEVMIALLVLALGILGISKLQGIVIQNSSDANQRSVAVNLAQKKIDDLKSFIQLDLDIDNDLTNDTWLPSRSLEQQSYAFINDNEGGTLCPAGDASFASTGCPSTAASIQIENYNFSLEWDVTPYYYNAVATTTPVSTAGTTVLSEFKQVDVTVSWTDLFGDSQSVILSTSIDAYAPISTGNEPVDTGGNSPIIPYTPKQAPDVIPVTLETEDGLKKETDKPLPDVSKKGDSTAVDFNTVTYNQSLDTVRREEFRTLACLCKNGSTVNTRTKGVTEWDSENLQLADVLDSDSSYSSSKTTVDNSGGESQDPDCFTCCRDGKDGYLTSGGSTYKACRLKRIDGIMRLFEPWKLIAFNVIPASYFDASASLPASSAIMDASTAEANIEAYSEYVTALVRASTGLIESSFNALGIDNSFAPDDFHDASDGILHRLFEASGTERQIQARAVYMDYPPIPDIFSDCASCATGTIADANVVPLDRVPFYEVNVTELAGWDPDRDNDGTYLPDGNDYDQLHDNVGNSPGCNSASAPSRHYVTNDAIENGCETSLSRGMFYPDGTAASEAVSTMIYTSNDGVVNKLIDTSAATPSITDITLEVQP